MEYIKGEDISKWISQIKDIDNLEKDELQKIKT